MDWSTVGSSTIEDDVEKFLWATDIASQITSGEVTDVRELSATLLGVGGSFVSSHSKIECNSKYAKENVKPTDVST